MTCLKCKQHELKLQHNVLLKGQIRGRDVEVVTDALVCPSCDYRTVPATKLAEFQKRSADAYREAVGFLTSAQLRGARKRLHMNQEKFASYIGVSVPSVKRWELGEIQTPAMDQLVRFKTDVAYAERVLADLVRRMTVPVGAPRPLIAAERRRKFEAPSSSEGESGPTDLAA